MTEPTTEAALRHPAVAAALLTDGVLHVVPDEHSAPLPHRAYTTDLPDGLAWHEPAEDLLVAGLNRTETDFLYREVWTENAYLRHGIVLPAGATVVDVGANIGMFSLFAAARSPGARIVAVEPMPEPARAVEANARLHRLDLTVVAAAVGRVPGEATFTFYPRNTVMSGQHADADEDRAVLRSYLSTDVAADGLDLDPMVADRLATDVRRVPVTTLPSVVTRAGLHTIDLLKIDVEKAEWDVLAGMDAPTWAMTRQIAIGVHDIDSRLAMTLDLLRDNGFTVSNDRDPRLFGTPCHTVYGRRPTASDVAAVPAVRPVMATGRALIGALREFLAEQGVPVPDRITVVGSLDRVVTAEQVTAEQVTTSTRATSVLAEIWAELFGAAAVRPDADFFALGGNSLTAVRLIARVESRLGEGVLAPDTVFTATRFDDLRAAVEAGLAREDA